MLKISIERGEHLFCAEYEIFATEVTVYGDRASESVRMDAMSAHQAAKCALTHLIRKGHVDPER